MSWITLVNKIQTQNSFWFEAITIYITTSAKPWTSVAGSLVKLVLFVFCTLILHHLVECTHSHSTICTKGTISQSHVLQERQICTHTLSHLSHVTGGSAWQTKEKIIGLHHTNFPGFWHAGNVLTWQGRKHWMHAFCTICSPNMLIHTQGTQVCSLYHPCMLNHTQGTPTCMLHIFSKYNESYSGNPTIYAP